MCESDGAAGGKLSEAELAEQLERAVDELLSRSIASCVAPSLASIVDDVTIKKKQVTGRMLDVRRGMTLG